MIIYKFSVFPPIKEHCSFLLPFLFFSILFLVFIFLSFLFLYFRYRVLLCDPGWTSLCSQAGLEFVAVLPPYTSRLPAGATGLCRHTQLMFLLTGSWTFWLDSPAFSLFLRLLHLQRAFLILTSQEKGLGTQGSASPSLCGFGAAHSALSIDSCAAALGVCVSGEGSQVRCKMGGILFLLRD